MPMEVICLQDAALYELTEQVTERIEETLNKPDKWISDPEAMKKCKLPFVPAHRSLEFSSFAANHNAHKAK